MRFTLTPKDRLALLKGLRMMFEKTLRSRRKEKNDDLLAIYNLARRLGEFRVGRPQRWSWYWSWHDEKASSRLEDFDKWIKDLETATREESSQLERSEE
jgi:hypothetical protein